MKDWVIEWSEQQQSFHIDKTQQTLDRNKRAYFSSKATQYIILDFADTIEEAEMVCASLKQSKEK